ncbi:hypothetical protein F5B17DRAFT_453731 [Nemania serpens]|nr:hypothetical protein F5B17DRAFT_453731 [Nemania serpens]
MHEHILRAMAGFTTAGHDGQARCTKGLNTNGVHVLFRNPKPAKRRSRGYQFWVQLRLVYWQKRLFEEMAAYQGKTEELFGATKSSGGDDIMDSADDDSNATLTSKSDISDVIMDDSGSDLTSTTGSNNVITDDASSTMTIRNEENKNGDSGGTDADKDTEEGSESALSPSPSSVMAPENTASDPELEPGAPLVGQRRGRLKSWIDTRDVQYEGSRCMRGLGFLLIRVVTIGFMAYLLLWYFSILWALWADLPPRFRDGEDGIARRFICLEVDNRGQPR